MSNISKKYKWSIYRSICYGAFIGTLFASYTIYQSYSLVLKYQDPDDPDKLSFIDLYLDTESQLFYYALGQIVGSIVGGAFIFGVIAKIRNYFIK